MNPSTAKSASDLNSNGVFLLEKIDILGINVREMPADNRQTDNLLVCLALTNLVLACQTSWEILVTFGKL